MISSIQEALSPHESLRLSIEQQFFEKLEKYQRGELQVEEKEENYLKSSLNLDDLKRETEPLTLYSPVTQKKIFAGIIARLKTSSENDTLIQGENPFGFRLKIFPKVLNQPQYVFFKFVENDPPPPYTVKGCDIFLLGEPWPKNLFQVAITLSKWPFLRIGQMPELPNATHKQINEMPHYQKKNLFNHIIMGRRPSSGLLFLDKLGLLDRFLPELTRGKNLQQNRFHLYDIFEHSIRALDGVIRADLTLRWSALLHDLGKVPTRFVKKNGEASFYNHELHSARMVVPIMKRMGVPRVIGERVKFLVRNHMFHYTHEWTDKAIRRFTKKIDQKDLEDLIELRLADRKGSGKKTAFPKGLKMLMAHIEEVKSKEQEFKVVDLEISGNDLIDLGLTPGPAIGKILKTLWLKVKNGEMPNEKSILLKESREMISQEIER